MTTQTFLASATAALKQANIETARLDCLVLLEDCLHKDRTHILAHPELQLNDDQISWLNARLHRRAQHEPLAYIRNRAEFYGRKFFVTEHTLVPRPETEAMVEMVIAIVLNKKGVRIADVGCGTGCIGISLALELPKATILLYDIDPQTLAIARKNSKQYGLQLFAAAGDLLHALPAVDVIVTNLPYVPESFRTNPEVSFEPSHAVFAGPDGLALYRRFWRQAAELQKKPTHILTESLPEQHASLTKLARLAGYRQLEKRDFVQHFVLQENGTTSATN